MPVVEIAGEFVGGVLRFAGHLILEVVLEFLIRGPGYLLCKPFKKDVDPDGGLVAVVGVAFWIVVAVSAWFIYREMSGSVAIDKCLDSGGTFDHQLNKCIAGT